MANKLSRPINEGGERADTVGVCSGMGHISVTTTLRGNKFLIRCHVGAVSIQSECWQEINDKQEVGVCLFKYSLEPKGLICRMLLLFSPIH